MTLIVDFGLSSDLIWLWPQCTYRLNSSIVLYFNHVLPRKIRWMAARRRSPSRRVRSRSGGHPWRARRRRPSSTVLAALSRGPARKRCARPPPRLQRPRLPHSTPQCWTLRVPCCSACLFISHWPVTASSPAGGDHAGCKAFRSLLVGSLTPRARAKGRNKHRAIKHKGLVGCQRGSRYLNLRTKTKGQGFE